MQQDFLVSGPLQEVLPDDIRADIVRIFTELLCRAIEDGDPSELVSYVEEVVWEARKLGATPQRFLSWIDHYTGVTRDLLGDQGWSITAPMLAVARQHIGRLQS